MGGGRVGGWEEGRRGEGEGRVNTNKLILQLNI